MTDIVFKRGHLDNQPHENTIHMPYAFNAFSSNVFLPSNFFRR
jgi:hypothetical protein